MNEVTIEVYSREEAGAILSSPAQRADVCFLISIGEPADRPPAGYANVRDKLRLLFADTTDHTGPTEDDIQRLIAIARSLNGRSGRVIAHCQAGISRSAAAAVIVYAVMLGPGREQEAVARVLQQRVFARPNWRMIEIADRLLRLEGRLIAAIRD
jgi:predicted protein tyrosine phosphatase